MKRTKKIKITKKLDARFQKVLKKIARNSQLFLLGKNESGTITSAIRLRRIGGCEFVPKISQGNLSDAYIRLLKRKVTPCGYALIRGTLDLQDLGIKKSLSYDYAEMGRQNLEIFIEYIKGYSGYGTRGKLEKGERRKFNLLQVSED